MVVEVVNDVWKVDAMSLSKFYPTLTNIRLRHWIGETACPALYWPTYLHIIIGNVKETNVNTIQLLQ